MKIYNIRNNESICEINKEQYSFLKAHLLSENDTDEDFSINLETIKTLQENAVSEEEVNLFEILKNMLEKEPGSVGLDFYIE